MLIEEIREFALDEDHDKNFFINYWFCKFCL